MNHTVIIAEAGVNHNGSMVLAKQLIDAAASAGVDYVKFQTFKTENLVSKQTQKADYQCKNMDSTDNLQFNMLKKLELSPAQHGELIAYCQEKKVHFFSTAFDLESIDFLSELNLGLWKIPSGELTNYPYLKKIAQKQQSVILSTGMSDLQDITNAISVLEKYGVVHDQITVLHCNTEYPTPMCDVNLRAMLTIAERFKVNVGYSDHTNGIEIPIAAVALGAKVIEKHFTLSREMDGPDHKASLEPLELKAMVKAIRNVEVALGSADKKITVSEAKNIVVARKSIIAACLIKRGDVFTEKNITIKRPGTGISPMNWESVLGQKAKKEFHLDDLIEL